MNTFFLKKAKIESMKSTDLRKQIGAVITKNGWIIGKGSNQATIKWGWFISWHKNNCLRKIFNIERHTNYWLCPGCALYKNHAEARAVKSIDPHIRLDGKLELFLFGHSECCKRCTKVLNKLNIKMAHDKI